MKNQQNSRPSSHPVLKDVARFAVRAMALTGAGMMLSGCAVAQFGSLFGGQKPQEMTGSITAPVPAQERSLSMAAADMTTASSASARDIADGSCPRISVWNQEAQLTIYEIGRVGDNLAIRHRGEITKTARECEIAPGEVTVKYGVAGRVLLGPLGQSGNLKLPVIVNITDRTRQTIKSEKLDVNVAVENGKPYGNFSVVQRVSFPLAPGANPGDYNLYVTFDKNAPGAG